MSPPSAAIDSLAKGQGDNGVIPEPASENEASQLRSTCKHRLRRLWEGMLWA